MHLIYSKKNIFTLENGSSTEKTKWTQWTGRSCLRCAYLCVCICAFPLLFSQNSNDPCRQPTAAESWGMCSLNCTKKALSSKGTVEKQNMPTVIISHCCEFVENVAQIGGQLLLKTGHRVPPQVHYGERGSKIDRFDYWIYIVHNILLKLIFNQLLHDWCIRKEIGAWSTKLLLIPNKGVSTQCFALFMSIMMTLHTKLIV